MIDLWVFLLGLLTLQKWREARGKIVQHCGSTWFSVKDFRLDLWVCGLVGHGSEVSLMWWSFSSLSATLFHGCLELRGQDGGLELRRPLSLSKEITNAWESVCVMRKSQEGGEWSVQESFEVGGGGGGGTRKRRVWGGGGGHKGK